MPWITKDYLHIKHVRAFASGSVPPQFVCETIGRVEAGIPFSSPLEDPFDPIERWRAHREPDDLGCHPNRGGQADPAGDR
jgi:hypothetical protein